MPLSRRAVLGLTGGAVAGAAGVALVDTLSEGVAPEPAAGTPTPERHRYAPHPFGHGDLYLPAGDPRGTVVVLHGGFWQSGYTLDLNAATSADLAGRGYAVWNLDYRSVGSGGGWPATFDDVRTGVAHLDRLDRVTPDRVVTLGHSAGGHLAVWVASEDLPGIRLRGAVSMAGVLDLGTAAEQGLGGDAVAALLGGGPGEVPDRYACADPIARVPLDIPVRCVHGDDDGTVPLGQSTAYVVASRAAGGDAALVRTPGGHFDALDPGTAMWRRTVRLLPTLLAAGDA